MRRFADTWTANTIPRMKWNKSTDNEDDGALQGLRRPIIVIKKTARERPSTAERIRFVIYDHWPVYVPVWATKCTWQLDAGERSSLIICLAKIWTIVWRGMRRCNLLKYLALLQSDRIVVNRRELFSIKSRSNGSYQVFPVVHAYVLIVLRRLDENVLARRGI